jgi:purine nucleosidase
MRKFIIDTDPGVDDAHAIMMAFAHPDVQVEAITTVAGNVGLELTTANALKILDVIEQNVPVFAGCDGALVSREADAANVHGNDGLGDCGIQSSSRSPAAGHAVNALIDFANRYPGEITLVTLGPLTNVALATRLDPALPKRFAKLVVMGGAIRGMGNTTNTTAEFNIHQDPEAAAIVFDNWPGLTLVSWETTMEHGIDASWYEDIARHDNQRSQFLQKISQKTIEFFHRVVKREQLFAADPLAMAVALDPGIITDARMYPIRLELFGNTTRGQTAVDWFGLSGQQPNANVVFKVDLDRFKELMEAAVA